MDRAIKATFVMAFILLAAMAGAMIVDRDYIKIEKNESGEWERVR